eukprot:jgi/Hompol1/234/HPOL_001868-RA
MAVKANTLIVEYRGEIIDTETCLERMRTIYKDKPHQYFIDFMPGLVLDGCRKGTVARFVNHSCEPNCHIEKWCVGGEIRIGVFSSVDINPGDEITYDYRFDAYGQMQICRCGSEKCRG